MIDWSKVKTNEQKLAEAAEQYLNTITAAVQKLLDEGAKSRRYDNIMSLCTYATSSNQRFAAEGQAGVVWRDAVWAKCYEMLEQYENGQIERPSVAEVLAALPEMVWPQ